MIKYFSVCDIGHEGWVNESICWACRRNHHSQHDVLALASLASSSPLSPVNTLSHSNCEMISTYNPLNFFNFCLVLLNFFVLFDWRREDI